MEKKGDPPKRDFFKVKNAWWDALTRYRIPGEQMQVVMHIIRMTFGWRRKEWDISNGEFVQATDIKAPNVCRAIKSLSEKRVIIVIKKDNKKNPTYRFNKYFKQWKVLSKKITNKSVIKKDNDSLSKKITPVIKKDNAHLFKERQLKTVKDTIAKNGMEKKARAVLRYLNRRKKSKYRDIKPVLARLNNGCTIKECITVIDNKFADEYFKQNPRFLNPTTLFRKSHWDKYLNDRPHPLEGKVSKTTQGNIEKLKKWGDRSEE